MSEEIISEIEEDLQKERFKKYWKNYGKYISLLIVFIIFLLEVGKYMSSLKKEEILKHQIFF